MVRLTRRSQFQSTFPRGERRNKDRVCRCGWHVSIHVPARGTTGSDSVPYASPTRFQSTFPRGERQYWITCQMMITTCFNPRSREGNDVCVTSTLICSPVFQSTFPRGERLGMSVFCSLLYFVSIHVPARGTTCAVSRKRKKTSGFNPRSREGNDWLRALVIDTNISTFQSTFPRGERLSRIRRGSRVWSFNPRSREGNDGIQGDSTSSGRMFQSTFPRGERPYPDPVSSHS